MKISYYAVFHRDSNGIWINFPDLPGCFSCGSTYENAEKMAQEALCLYLHELSENQLPRSTTLDKIPLSNNQEAVLITVNLIVENGILVDNNVINIEKTTK